ncbi:MAG TPA: hypothetical protein VGO68_06475 [Pyrinomonadaceae bacterium]|nr:hypothetical protein [Pyrinomonadaceae bacterium]
MTKASNASFVAWPEVIKRILLGILLGAVLTPATTQAQFTVFDPAQYALQIERQLEEASRWLERVKQYTDQINKMVEQITTMKGVLSQAEKLVLHNANLTRTMAQIGQTVRDVFALKRAMETMVISRLNMIRSIKSRLASGIFDPQADLRDFEDLPAQLNRPHGTGQDRNDESHCDVRCDAGSPLP